MIDKEFEKGQYIANWAQLVEDKISIIVPVDQYDVSEDDRLLIPFIKNHKIGFVDQSAICIVEQQFDKFQGEIKSPEALLCVAKRFSYGFSNRGKDEVRTYDRDKWGVLDSNGKLIVDTEYKEISVSDNFQLLTLHDFNKGYCVINRNGDIIVPYGMYNYIDGFTNGYARVKIGKVTNGLKMNNNFWGIIDDQGKVVLPLDYSNIWNFYGKPGLKYTKVIKDGREHRFYFSTETLDIPSEKRTPIDFYDDYGSHYGEFAGSYAQDVMGYSDDVINDAFEGDPDNYWNID
ncbi:WG repeat-containing protein [uncultured Bacteroides sp.]|jgi:hypothetical protein|uniref:WG repeat-containing protein n=1 Tax=uncultured Bacteroides sp. TaxID=162156 RepID=UPI00280B1273|nr:WG repeat-containing protein [uncultured Bacteroides sp.]